MSEIPPDLHYTAEHEWIRRTGDDTVRVGITDFAQQALGDVVFVRLPDVGSDLSAGDAFGEVESTKSVSDLYAPVTAKVVAVNEDLEASPELVNSDPYGGGWLIDLQVDAEALQSGVRRAAGRRDLPRHADRMTLVIVPCARQRCTPDRARTRTAIRCRRRSGGGRHIGLLCAVRSSHRRPQRVGSRSSGPNQTTQQRPVRSSG